MGDQVPEINQFIEQELERHGSSFSGQGRPEVLGKEAVLGQLNDVFRAAVLSKTA